MPTTPDTELLLMMCPLRLAFMLGRTALIKRRVPKKFTSNISWAMFMGIHSTAQIQEVPALLTEKEKIVSFVYNLKESLRFFVHQSSYFIFFESNNMPI